MGITDLKDSFYSIFNKDGKYTSTLKETSKDKTNKVVMVNSNFAVLNFDKIKEDYNAELKSVDALFFSSCGTIFFIEFKNGIIKEKKEKEIVNKIYDSINIFSDISCSNKPDLVNMNPINFLKNNSIFILVYNKEKNSKYAMISHLAKKSDQEIVFGRLGFLKGYLFKEVHTYTTDEFEKKELNQWEAEQEISSLK